MLDITSEDYTLEPEVQSYRSHATPSRKFLWVMDLRVVNFYLRSPMGRVPELVAPVIVRGGQGQANKNSFVRSSLIVSRSFAAFSNSNRLAASRMSLSSLPI